MNLNLKKIIISVLVFAMITAGGAYLISAFAGEDIDFPGDEQGELVQDRLTSYMEEISGITEDAGLLSGAKGIVGIIKTLVIDVPIYAGVVIMETAAYLGLPATVGITVSFILLGIAIYEGLLLLRGVSQ